MSFRLAILTENAVEWMVWWSLARLVGWLTAWLVRRSCIVVGMCWNLQMTRAITVISVRFLFVLLYFLFAHIPKCYMLTPMSFDCRNRIVPNTYMFKNLVMIECIRVVAVENNLK